MNTTDQSPLVDDINELVGIASLTGVRASNLNASLADSDAKPRGNNEPDNGPVLKVGVAQVQDSLTYRFSLTVLTDQARVSAEIEVTYTLGQPVALTERVRLEFAERVAVMAAVPYLRESVHALASRLGIDPPLMGMVRQGELHFAPATDGQSGHPERSA